MTNKINSMLSSTLGKQILSSAKRMIEKNNVDLKQGVLVGFSGGPDSVMLLSVMSKLAADQCFKLLAVHVNHGIRGEEADRDEAFSKSFSDALGVEFIAKKIDVPAMARELSKSLETAARDARYSEFSNIIKGRNDVAYVAVAHNSSDNLETVIFNMLRGSGARGMSGIPEMRGNIIRPLLDVTKRDIVSLLDCFGVNYVIDTTNDSDDYSRNYIRHNVIPTLRTISDFPENAVRRMSIALRQDEDYITSEAQKFIYGHHTINNTDLGAMHAALRVRVIKLMAAKIGAEVYDYHVNKIARLLSKDNFQVCVHGGVFVSEHGACHFEKNIPDDCVYEFDLADGRNLIPEFGSEVFIGKVPFEETFLNVYNFSIKADLSSAIIVGSLRLRSKEDGDTIFYRGHTRKLKKLFCDTKIPRSLRSRIPILCDDKGVVWVPGFGVRDDQGSEPLYIAIASNESVGRFVFGNEF